jgi:two-component system OmpR family sensor kinase
MSSQLDNARLAVLVHEVRSPVAALSSVAEAVAHLSRDEADVRELVRLTIASCRAIERIVLDVAVASIRVETVDVGALVRDTAAAHVLHGASVVVHADDGVTVDGDPIRLRQVFDNLVSNAIIHGGSAAVDVRVLGSGTDVRVAVSDSGPGIPTSERERIFEVGTRLAHDRPGSGLGLPLARAVVEAHGGSIRVDSTGREGATFVVTLPARRDHPDTAALSS